MLRLGIDPEKPYRATFICQDGLCCCNMALISFRLFRKNLGNLRDFFGQMVYRPPWQKNSRTPMVSGMVLVDYRKAFDMVDHELLLRKLNVYGVANQKLNWCRSYLCSRKQVVHVRGKESGEAMLRYGVSQGSIIGPLFFIPFINDLPLHVSADVDLYADDTTVTASADVKNLAHLDLSLNKSFREIQAWANVNKLPITPENVGSYSRVFTVL